jgi:glutathione S-transferase
MADTNQVILRYFSCRGRAQPLRDALSDAGVAFDDVQITDWRARPQPPEIAGLFGSLPTLTWGDVDACETLPMARLIGERLGHTRGLSERRVVELEAACSAMLTDVLVPIAHAIWSDLLFPGSDAKGVTARQSPRWRSKLARAAALLPRDRPFLGGEAPVIADFFLFEAFDTLGMLLGPALAPRLERELPRLTRLARDLLARPRVASVYAARPPRFTGRPDEPQVLARLHAGDPSELWPASA